MAVNAAKQYVVPAGEYLFSGITGQDPSLNAWQNAGNVFDTGTNDPRGPFGTVNDAWNAQRLGYGVVAAPPGLEGASQDASQRYFGDPNNGGAGGWNARWNQWNGTDVVGPDGNLLLSPVHQTGLRVGQDYGVGRNAQGDLAGPAGGDIFKGFTYAQNKLSQNPYLDPTQALGGYNAAMQNSPFAMADPSQYMNTMSPADGRQGMAAIGSSGLQQAGFLNNLPGSDFERFGKENVHNIAGLNQLNDFDQYGLRGIDQTNALDTANLAKLTRNIDTQSQQTLANQLPQVQQAMEAAGLGRSGAGQMALMQNQNQILEQANRDKQSTLADFINKNADRGAQAINLATQQGYGGQGQEYGQLANAMNAQAQMGYGGMGQKFGAVQNAATLGTQLSGQAQNQYMGLLGQAGMQGLQDRNAANMLGRQGASSLWQQAMDQQSQRYGQDSTNYLNALVQGGQFQNAALQNEMNGQHMALGDWMGLQASRDQTQASSMNQMLALQDAQRQIDQQRRDQELQASMMPYDSMMRIATGTTAPSGPQVPNSSFWNNGLGQGIGQGLGQGAGQWASGALFGGGNANSGTPIWQGTY